MSGKRGNGEGSIYPYRNNSFAAYVWVSTPDGKRKRKYVYGKTREEVHDKWIKLHAEAKKGPVATRTPTVQQYLTYWLREVVKPDLKPKTYENYELLVRLFLVPGLGGKRLDKLSVRDVREWMNRAMEQCRCCARGVDADRSPEKRRCCAVGQCCRRRPSRRTVNDARAVLRSALTHAMTEELISKNAAGLVKVRAGRKQRREPWTVEEARTFLEAARGARDPLYPAYVLVLVLGFRRGEVLGLSWQDVDLEAGQITVGRQLQRISRRLVHDETKTEASTATLPLPQICVTALQLRRKTQQAARKAAGELWTDSDFVFTTRYGTPIEPRNFNRSFDARSAKARVRKIRLHDTRHTCGSLLAALDVHPRVAMQILRHSKIAITMEVYTHVPSDATRKALRKLGKHLGGPSSDQGQSP
ncbi:site-specific integrase [Streptomyces daqingensis]|uniref:Site-specific integrase n=2 Tax=Streptomyces daqingensis TaxID=1472640 RepID=A0ABQ2ME29_9ACTN|nr:site-specific integrase [Streptomyces daqingensis]GGO50409.1 site-specific integrase [Streptomyces daqingensis]